MNICVVGSGFVGLVAAACFADNGHDVIGVDVDRERVEGLNRGEVPIFEPGLEELVRRNLEQDRLRFMSDLAGAVRASFIIFIAVGTPPRDDGSSDLAAVQAVAEDIGRQMDGEKVIVIKSTVPVGTHRQVREWVGAHTRHNFYLVSNPEFLKEGSAVSDFLKPSRVILGSDSPIAASLLEELYAPFLRTGNPIMIMDPASAEMAKYAANTMLATRISFINEIAALCEACGADVQQVRRGMAADERIGKHFLFPGIGYGGSCLPKDVRSLIDVARKHRIDAKLLAAVDQVNQQAGRQFARKIANHFGGDLAGRRLAVWGLAFKPNTNDLRTAPSVPLVRELLESGAKLSVFDPAAMDDARAIFAEALEYAADPYQALAGADAVAIVTEWNLFRRPNLERMRSLLKRPVIFDGRNVLTPANVREQGFVYYGVGVP